MKRRSASLKVKRVNFSFRRSAMRRLTLLSEIERRWPNLKVMMVTAYGDEERRRTAQDRGAADFIAKPVDFQHPEAATGAVIVSADLVGCDPSTVASYRPPHTRHA
jgi:DNA-binding NtrC family response regulator